MSALSNWKSACSSLSIPSPQTPLFFLCLSMLHSVFFWIQGGLAAAVCLKENVGHLFSATPFTPTQQRRWKEVITSFSVSLPPPLSLPFSLHLEWDTSGAPCALPVAPVCSMEALSVHTYSWLRASSHVERLWASHLSCRDNTWQDAVFFKGGFWKHYFHSLLALLQTNSVNSSLYCITLIWFIYGTVPSSKQIKLLVYWLELR